MSEEIEEAKKKRRTIPSKRAKGTKRRVRVESDGHERSMLWVVLHMSASKDPRFRARKTEGRKGRLDLFGHAMPELRAFGEQLRSGRSGRQRCGGSSCRVPKIPTPVGFTRRVGWERALVCPRPHAAPRKRVELRGLKACEDQLSRC